ncbi:MAG: hypothetical protein ACRBK7_14925 [Acidimicrobiales bacterium]
MASFRLSRPALFGLGDLAPFGDPDDRPDFFGDLFRFDGSVRLSLDK